MYIISFYYILHRLEPLLCLHLKHCLQLMYTPDLALAVSIEWIATVGSCTTNFVFCHPHYVGQAYFSYSLRFCIYLSVDGHATRVYYVTRPLCLSCYI